MTTDAQAPAATEPLFEGFALVMLAPAQEARAREIAARELGPEWRVRPFGDEGLGFELTHAELKRGALAPGEAWQAAYRLRSLPGVVNAEPIFAAPPPPGDEAEDEGAASGESGEEFGGPGDIPFGSVFGSGHLDGSEDPEWSPQLMRVPEAWEVYRKRRPGTLPGDGVVVGHPDTGFTRHPEIVNHLLVEKGYDFESDDADAEDPLEGSEWKLQFPGHGTGTSSVIVSAGGAEAKYPGDPSGKAVKGIAPGAKLIPLRISKSVVLWNGSVLNLSRAIEHATEAGAHVISMSLGTGFPSPRLLSSIVDAQRRGVIVLAAAGNYVRVVVWPAAYQEVVGVAACNVERSPWRHSSRGGAVDVTAPGESVWCARSVRGDAGITPDVDRGSGTSYAVAAVAGIAAMWLSYHGREELAARYGAEKIPAIFHQILRQSCEADSDWEANRYGAGIVNAEKVLTAPLPDGVEHPVPALHLPSAAGEPSGVLGLLAHIFEQPLRETLGLSFSAGELTPEEKLRAALARLLNTPAEGVKTQLSEVGRELAFYLATSPELYEQFETVLAQEAGGLSFDSGAPDTVEGVRASLLLGGASDALKGKLTAANTP